jgi:hypothetical protein
MEIKGSGPKQPGPGHASPNFYQMTFLPPLSLPEPQGRGNVSNDSNAATVALGALPNNNVDLTGTLALASLAPAWHPLALRRAFSFPVPLGFRTVPPPVGGSSLPFNRDLTAWSSDTSFPSLSLADIALVLSRQRMMCGPPQTDILSELQALQRADSASFPLLRAYLQRRYTTDAATTRDRANTGPPFGL